VHDSQLPVLARTLHGIEDIARNEVRARLGVVALELGHRQLRFAAPLTPELVQLGTVDDVFVVLAELDGLSRRRDSLARVASLSLDLDAPARLFGRSGPRTFDVTGSFLGRRNFSRFELEDALGHSLAATTGWAHVARSGTLSSVSTSSGRGQRSPPGSRNSRSTAALTA